MVTTGEIITALKGDSLSTKSTQERRMIFEQIARSTLALSGYTIADGLEDMAQPIADILRNRIFVRYPNLRDKEIELALQAGVMGEWTKTRVPTAANVGAWVEAYLKCDAHRDALKQVAAIANGRKGVKDDIPADLKAEMNAKARRDSAIKAWEDFKALGHLDIFLDGYAAMIYDYLVSCGILKASPEAIDQAFKASRLRAAKNRGDAFARIGRTQETGHRGDWETKRELLSMFFRHLKENGKELKITL